ncbi:hypothetical protein GCM10027285_24540 [Oleiagrimonas citrea]|uniref:ATP-grasp domain-containing protein n=1 Tax=Oleiagrimonas citrea TaxID=1665687 RepID=A0A846ZMB2_9GAMM|nr:hypothetical protein [Oleiagrimonas citrea]NKZ38797.1 hypothetical protein [Oleiagrimonas citrea]
MEAAKPVLVVLGSKVDPHVSRVSAWLENDGSVEVKVIDYLDDTYFELSMDESGRYSLCIDGEPLAENYIIWNRVKILPGSELYLKGDDQSAGYAAREWRAFYSLLCGFCGSRVVNSLQSRMCMIKPYQQALAAESGFLVAPSMVTNKKNSVKDFYSENSEKIIMKSLSGAKVKPEGDGGVPFNIMTMRVSSEDLDGASDEQIRYCPHFFQREIVKKYELRVVVVGDRVIPFRIDSQKYKASSLDWRKGHVFDNFKPCAIDDEITKKIKFFMRRMGFFFGSIDIVVDTDGRHWFLECNQDGAWGWLDDIVDGALTRVFATEFMRLLGVNFTCDEGDVALV